MHFGLNRSQDAEITCLQWCRTVPLLHWHMLEWERKLTKKNSNCENMSHWRWFDCKPLDWLEADDCMAADFIQDKVWEGTGDVSDREERMQNPRFQMEMVTIGCWNEWTVKGEQGGGRGVDPVGVVRLMGLSVEHHAGLPSGGVENLVVGTTGRPQVRLQVLQLSRDLCGPVGSRGLRRGRLGLGGGGGLCSGRLFFGWSGRSRRRCRGDFLLRHRRAHLGDGCLRGGEQEEVMLKIEWRGVASEIEQRRQR